MMSFKNLTISTNQDTSVLALFYAINKTHCPVKLKIKIRNQLLLYIKKFSLPVFHNLSICNFNTSARGAYLLYILVDLLEAYTK